MTEEQQRSDGVGMRDVFDILQGYLKAYCETMQGQGFKTHYVEPFAQTGRYAPNTDANQLKLFPGDCFDDSSVVALKTDPEFDVCHFNALEADCKDRMKHMAAEFSDKEVEISCGEANEFTKAFCSSLKASDRAVLFVDPPGAKMEWKTIRKVASTRKIDIWMKFPFSTILQMARKEKRNIPKSSRRKLDRVLGPDAWEECLYSDGHQQRRSIFDAECGDTVLERVERSKVESWLTERFRSAFDHVSDPVPLLNAKKATMSLLFFASPQTANEKVAGDIIRCVMRKRGRRYMP